MSLKKKMVAAALLQAAIGTAAVSGVGAAGADNAKVDLLDQVDHVQWLDVNRLIASQETENGRVDYILYPATGKFEKLLDAADASELVVSHDGSKAAYSDSTGAVHVLDLVTKTAKTVSTDSSIKPELVWSADGTALYFLQGDKGSVICVLDVTSGAITKVLDDKKDYKGNLHVSANGKWLTYTITVPPVVTAPSDKAVEEDAVAIDDSTAATNMLQYANDATIKDNKAVQLTKSTDDKIVVGADRLGYESYYISVAADAEGKSKLIAVTSAGKERTLFADEDVIQARYAGGTLYAMTSGADGKNRIYAISTAGAAPTLLYAVSEETTGFEVSKSGVIAIEAEGKFYVDVNGVWTPVTR